MVPGTFEGVIENGLIRPLTPLPLREGDHVVVTLAPSSHANSLLNDLTREQGLTGATKFDSQSFTLPVDDEFLRELREHRTSELAS